MTERDATHEKKTHSLQPRLEATSADLRRPTVHITAAAADLNECQEMSHSCIPRLFTFFLTYFTSSGASGCIFNRHVKSRLWRPPSVLISPSPPSSILPPNHFTPARPAPSRSGLELRRRQSGEIRLFTNTRPGVITTWDSELYSEYQRLHSRRRDLLINQIFPK